MFGLVDMNVVIVCVSVLVASVIGMLLALLVPAMQRRFRSRQGRRVSSSVVR